VIKKSLCTWWLQYRKLQVMFKLYPSNFQTVAQSECLAADRQGKGDTKLTLTPSVIPNSNCVIMVSDWNYLKYFYVLFCTISSGAQRLFDHPVYQHSESNVIHFLFSLLRINSLYMFRALVAHPQEHCTNNNSHIACVLCQLAASLQFWRSQLT
jgi:hypothetical protein